MQRVYAVVKEEIVHLVDDRAKVMGITRSLWISKAIESYLHLPGDDTITSGDERITQGDEKVTFGDDEVTTLKALLEKAIAEADNLRGDLQVKEGDLSHLKTDAELKWRETGQLRSEVSQLKRDLESTRTKADHLQVELDKKRTETERAHADLNNARLEAEKFEMAFKAKDDEINFLRGHLSQLSEKLNPKLPPSEEEAKKKGWTWRFWRRD
jgi:chromosome segregation ATPase